MVRVEEAEKIILLHTIDYGIETVILEHAGGKVLAENITADRDMPPFNRTTLDGIAIRYQGYEQGTRSFSIQAVQAAGDDPINIHNDDECVEIMTGSALPESTDTIVPYEDIQLDKKVATIRAAVQKGQNIHIKGKDRKAGDQLADASQLITPAIIAVAASVGKAKITVKKMPETVIISTGNELIEVHEHPSLYQVRRSNNYMIRAALQQVGLEAHMLHIPDDLELIKTQLKSCLQRYDVIILSGGVSMGKFDYLPEAFKSLEVQEHFYKVQQRPGKPFWFGTHATGSRIFACPGNPVSTFLCLHRYIIPWLTASMGVQPAPSVYASLSTDLTFKPALQYFVQVKLHIDHEGRMIASPAEGNGSGDFSNLLVTNAFMELPLEQVEFKKGEVFRVWPYSGTFL